MRNRLRKLVLSFFLKPITVDILRTHIGFYDKLKALLEGLEIEHIEDLLANGDVETYRLIGRMIAQKCKWSKDD